MTFKVVIPARYASTRLPGKPLLEIAGKPMLQWVIDAAKRSGAEEVLVATDDIRIAQALPMEKVVMTSDTHRSGTDRLAEVAQLRGWPLDAIVVNVQGDEPMLPPVLIDQVAALLKNHPGAQLATLSTPVQSLDDFLNPNVVKVVSTHEGAALYFSRAPIPWWREHASAGLASQTSFAGAQRHLGIYAYRVGALLKLTAMPPGALELAESLEQLRALQAGLRIMVAEAAVTPGPGVDTAQDIEKVRELMSKSAP
jgi:3-deoxy-manno-octulosonate cytidylyltransferase (CMP-KDO synthetase)